MVQNRIFPKFVAIGAIATSLGCAIEAAPASAADMPVKAPVYAPPVYSWNGFYVGLSLGARWSDTTWTTTCTEASIGFVPLFCSTASPRLPQGNPASFNSSTFRGGIHGGYNWQFASLWVAGVETDVAWGNSSKTLVGIPGTLFPGQNPALLAVDSSTVTANWDGSVRGRIGFLASPTVLIYGTGGVAWQQISVTANCSLGGPWCAVTRSESFTTTKTGWTIGGGAEATFWGNWLGRVEYRYADYGHVDHSFFANTIDQVGMTESLRTHTVLVGLGYKFGGPVYANY